MGRVSWEWESVLREARLRIDKNPSLSRAHHMGTIELGFQTAEEDQRTRSARG